MNRDVVAALAILASTAGMGTAQAAGRFVIGIGAGTAAVDGVTETDPTPPFTLPQLPSSISLNGLPLDDDDFTGKAFVRYEFLPRVGVELAYRDLGEFRNPHLLSGRTATLGISQTSASGYYRLPLSSRFSVKGTLGLAYADFEVSGSTPVIGFGTLPNLTTNPGRIVPNSDVLLNPAAYYGIPPINVSYTAVSAGALASFPLASPDSEWGMTWGLAFEWNITDRWGLELAYDQHRIKVQDVESVGLALTFGF